KVFRSAALEVSCGRYFFDTKSETYEPRIPNSVVCCENDFRLAAVFAGDLDRRSRTLPAINVGKQTWIEIFVEEDLDGKDTEGAVAVTPENLIPGSGRTVKEPLGSDDEPVAAIIDGEQGCELFSSANIPQTSFPVVGGRDEQLAIRTEGK